MMSTTMKYRPSEAKNNLIELGLTIWFNQGSTKYPADEYPFFLFVGFDYDSASQEIAFKLLEELRQNESEDKARYEFATYYKGGKLSDDSISDITGYYANIHLLKKSLQVAFGNVNQIKNVLRKRRMKVDEILRMADNVAEYQSL